MNKQPCPLCNQGYLTDKVVYERISDDNVSYELINDELTPLYYSECDYCGSEQADEFQVRANLDAVKK